jgi:hypothetical protein
MRAAYKHRIKDAKEENHKQINVHVNNYTYPPKS